NQIKATITTLGSSPSTIDYYTRCHIEEINLHGDPALRINNFAKPDYVVEDQFVKLSPQIISVADGHFSLNVKFMNIGRAIRDSMRVTVKQQLPDNSIRVLYDHVIPATLYSDSLVMTVPINPNTDKGLNKILVSLDEGNRIDELAEDNNKLSKDFYIFEDELSPVSPYNFSIVNNQNVTFYASTANAVSGLRTYLMEIDTTEQFNSPFKKSYSTNGVGGIVQFTPNNLTFTDSTVYYWRTATSPSGTNSIIWNTFSFIYKPTGGPGSNQSHYYQHLRSDPTNITLASDGKWKFTSGMASVKMKNGVFPTAANQAQDFEVNVDGGNIVQSVCTVSGLIVFTVFNPVDFKPISNSVSGPGLYGSDDVCGPSRQYSFNYSTLIPQKRYDAVSFLDNVVPNGYYVVAMNLANVTLSQNTFADVWQGDTSVLGHNNSLYHRLKSAGFAQIDSFNRPRAFNFIYKKQDNSFVPVYKLSDSLYDKIDLTVDCPTIKGSGSLTSPLFGPARSWTEFHWRGSRLEAGPGDSVSFNIIGVSPAGIETPLMTIDSTNKDVNISSISAAQYPYLKLQMNTQDTIQGTP
ncbi:MAG TPA: hypothetical protein VKH37_07620, partial [Ferruginibacter sp.]|nr:hypothetical protein [Ferruginibacter sp.]